MENSVYRWHHEHHLFVSGTMDIASLATMDPTPLSGGNWEENYVYVLSFEAIIPLDRLTVLA